MGWKIEFNSFTASRYTYVVPLPAKDGREEEGEVEECKDDYVVRR